jgi:hypothetical protein
VRYEIELGESRSQARATGITLDGIRLGEQMDRCLLIACTSFCREAALPWERYASKTLRMPCSDPLADSTIETDLLVRDEMIAFILAHGGVTTDGGAQRDGRLTILE